MEAIWNISGMYGYPVKCFCVEFLLDFWLTMMHQYGYGYWYDMGRGTGIQHFLKNLGYNTLEMQQILLYFFPPSPVSDWYSLYLGHILHVSKPYQYKKIIFFAWYSPGMVVAVSISGTFWIPVRWKICRISASELIDELMCLMPSILNLVWIVTFEIAFYL